MEGMIFQNFPHSQPASQPMLFLRCAQPMKYFPKLRSNNPFIAREAAGNINTSEIFLRYFAFSSLHEEKLDQEKGVKKEEDHKRERILTFQKSQDTGGEFPTTLCYCSFKER